MAESLGLCACMGPIAGDPYCPCEMRRKGLEPTNLWTPEKVAELHKALSCFIEREEDNNAATSL